MRYIYHYCAQASSGRGTSFSSAKIDGILSLVKKIESMDDYREIKRLIVEPFDSFRVPSAKITIESLEFLHEVE